MKRINPDFNAAARSELALLDWKFQAALAEAMHDDPARASAALAESHRLADAYRDKFFDQFKTLEDFERALDTADPGEMTLEYIHIETMRFIHNPDNDGLNPFLKDATALMPGRTRADIDADFQKNFVQPYRNFLKKLKPAQG
jgi:hypothetical protein